MRVIALVLLIILSSTQIALAANPHWAYSEIEKASIRYGLVIDGNWDSPASLALQEKVFSLAGLSLKPKENIQRVEVIYYLTKELKIDGVDVDNIDLLLSTYIDKCDY